MKKEQSLADFPRHLNTQDWIATTQACDLRILHYPEHYVNTLHELMNSLQHISNIGTFANPFNGPKPLKYGQHKDYALYSFFKWAVSQNMEWDEEAYLALYPQLVETIEASSKTQFPYIDGLHYFVRQGFWDSHTSCWQTMDPINRDVPIGSVCI